MIKSKTISDQLRLLADNIDAGNSNATEDEMMSLIEDLSFMINPETKLSKYQAIKHLNISRATFDNYVAQGKIPKGRKQQGFKELY